MTEKRFFILIDDEYEDTLPVIRDRTFKIKDIYGHYRYDNLEEICNELNRLNDENEQLKSSDTITDLETEIMNLKTTIHQLRTDNTKQKKKLNTTMKENEQLRQELHIYHKLASCSNRNYHDYDWYDDGDEFEVCRKGNDVTERICKEWREL